MLCSIFENVHALTWYLSTKHTAVSAFYTETLWSMFENVHTLTWNLLTKHTVICAFYNETLWYHSTKFTQNAFSPETLWYHFTFLLQSSELEPIHKVFDDLLYSFTVSLRTQWYHYQALGLIFLSKHLLYDTELPENYVTINIFYAWPIPVCTFIINIGYVRDLIFPTAYDPDPIYR
jgi:hypothetical protein